jgi:hypothetical protein
MPQEFKGKTYSNISHWKIKSRTVPTSPLYWNFPKILNKLKTQREIIKTQISNKNF